MDASGGSENVFFTADPWSLYQIILVLYFCFYLLRFIIILISDTR